MENNNCNRHIYLYAKHWYKRTDIVEDLKIICAERCGCYSTEYHDVNNLEEVNKCKVSVSDVLNVMTNLVQKYMKNDVNNYLFLEFINDIAPWNTWKVGYLNKQCNALFMSKKELEEAPEYDYIKAVLHKYCSILSNMEVSKIKEIDNCELGEPDYKLFPMFKLEEKQK